jgi:hypothetical protein
MERYVKTITKWNDNVKKVKSETDKIDFVYTYVDSSDQIWIKKYEKAFPTEKIDPVRYKSYGEIYFSLKTIERYAKYVCNNIYIVTDNQRLESKELSNWCKKRLKYIDHTDIIPSIFLPTFNSITIESFLHRIPHLTKNFIYLNDDIFLGNYLKKDFIYNKGTPNILIYINNKRRRRDPKKPWEYYYLNGNDLIFERFNLQQNILGAHTYYMMNVDVCNMVWLLFQKELCRSMTKKRESKNINFWYLCYGVGLYLGYFKYKVPKSDESLIMYCEKVGNKDMKKRIVNEVKMLFKKKPVTFCLNNLNDQCKKLWDFIQERYK